MKNIAIYGAGGFAREVLILLEDMGLAARVSALYESDDIWTQRRVGGIQTLPISRFEPSDTDMILAVGSPQARQRMRESLPAQTQYPTLVHPNAKVHRSTSLGEGSIVCEGCIVTCDIRIGRHVNLDRMTTIGHDSVLGDFVTAAPAVVVSGNCMVGASTYLGTNSCLREKISIPADSIIGMGAVVISSLTAPGVYVGNPARLKSS
ncbi:acetyltransferase [Lysobacter capsici]|uniref:acetyltransferase n=1 Tax=Lysobacter capsici TaxID=435897 RepID=UPI000A968473|nr:acetyltransferase [Lysobacter capsici]